MNMKTRFQLGFWFGIVSALLATSFANAASSKCKEGAPAWYFHSLNEKNSIDYKTETRADGIVEHRWYMSPEEHAAGNQLSLVYEEDPKLPRLKIMDQLIEGKVKSFAGFYLVCSMPPSRFFFSGGYYYSRYVVSNFESCPESCLLTEIVPFDATKSKQSHVARPNEDLKNPNLAAALTMVAHKDKKASAAPQPVYTAPPVPRVAKKVARGKVVSPPKGIKRGSYFKIAEMPDEVLNHQK
jgi:hypothetical protein